MPGRNYAPAPPRAIAGHPEVALRRKPRRDTVAAMHRLGLAVSGFALTLGLAAAAAGQAVVVSNSADIGFARGTEIADGAAVRVPDGHTLSLIDANGKGMAIRGPFDGKLGGGGSAAPANASVLSALHLILVDQKQTETGAVRAAGETPQPPDARLVELSDSATFCVAPGQKPELWRPSPRPHATLTLTRLSNGTRGEVDWPASQATVIWPDAVPIVDGESYQALLPGAMVRPRLVLKVVPLDAPSIAAAQKLSQAGCGKQAVTMLEGIATAGGAKP
jgi:hypothetical protein